MSVSLERYRIHLTGLQLAELSPLDISEQETIHEMPALPDSAQLPDSVREWARQQLDGYARKYGGYKQAAITKPQLPVDAEGRPYLKVINPFEDTQDLVHAAVTRFIELEGTRPQVILLSGMRYFTYGMRELYWQPQQRGMDAIPFGYEKDVDYDVLIVGEQSS